MIRAHFTHSYLLNPQHPVTVNLIGAGGTGSQVLTNLARLDATLVALGHPGLYVRVYDPDDVEAPNIGRQNFSPADLGQNKARSLITRVNAFFGLDWEAVPEKFPADTASISKEDLANLFITCTDNITSRYELAEFLKAAIATTKKDGTDYQTPLNGDGGNTADNATANVKMELKMENVLGSETIVSSDGYYLSVSHTKYTFPADLKPNPSDALSLLKISTNYEGGWAVNTDATKDFYLVKSGTTVTSGSGGAAAPVATTYIARKANITSIACTGKFTVKAYYKASEIKDFLKSKGKSYIDK